MVCVILTVGVPLTTPFAKVNPSGKEGSIAHVAIAPPVFVATTLVIATPLVPVWVVGESVILAVGSLIVI